MTAPTHSLKTWPEFFDAVRDGRKTFEVRKNDRGFNAGDRLFLRKYRPCAQFGSLSGFVKPDGYHTTSIETEADTIELSVTYVLSGFGIEPGFVVIGFLPVGEVTQ